MEKLTETYSSVMQACPLFVGVAQEEYPNMLRCLSAVGREYEKNDMIFRAGAPIEAVGIVLNGSVHVEMDDYWGNRTILARVDPGELFGEAFSCAGTQRLPVSVYAATPAVVLLVDYRRILQGDGGGCAFQSRLIQNMMRILAQKNVALTQKMETITQRTTRDKLLTYLSLRAIEAGNERFFIPFNRQELADYLSVDRSAMSAELSRMQKDGLLHYNKNWFDLIQ